MIDRAWNGLSTLAVAIGITALTACGDQGTSGAGEKAECTAFDDESAASVPIHIVNHRASRVFLRTQCDVSFHVVDGANERYPAQRPPLVTSCARAQEGEDDTIGDCMEYGTVFIEPGMSRDLTWGGVVYGSVTMPAECVPPDAVRSCEQATAPEPGSMTFAVEIYADESMPLETFEVTAPFVYGTDKSITLDVN